MAEDTEEGPPPVGPDSDRNNVSFASASATTGFAFLPAWAFRIILPCTTFTDISVRLGRALRYLFTFHNKESSLS